MAEHSPLLLQIFLERCVSFFEKFLVVNELGPFFPITTQRNRLSHSGECFLILKEISKLVWLADDDAPKGQEAALLNPPATSVSS